MQMSFLRLCSSSVVVFSETQDFNKRLCFTLQAVAQKQWQLLEKLKKVSFLKIRFIMQSEVEIYKCSSVLRKNGFNRMPCFNVRAVAPEQRKMFEKLKNNVSRNENFMQLCFLSLSLSEMLICQGFGALATGASWLPASHAKSSPARGAPQRR